jgi:hypothetical protein
MSKDRRMKKGAISGDVIRDAMTKDDRRKKQDSMNGNGIAKPSLGADFRKSARGGRRCNTETYDSRFTRSEIAYYFRFLRAA